MVYFGGKPSAGCQNCRSKKIRCDQRPGGCGYCQKKEVICPGYRSELDMKFRDESQQVGQKVMNKARSKARAKEKISAAKLSTSAQLKCSPPSTERNDNSDLPLVSKSGNKNLPLNDHGEKASAATIQLADNISVPISMVLSTRPGPSLSPNLDDQALGFFFANHIIGGNQQTPNSPSTWVNDTFLATGKALGIAGISNFMRTTDLKRAAQKQYIAAIQAVNNALGQPSTATDDATLISILLLVQFETVECFSLRSLAYWETHLRGAAAVLKMRGAERLRKPNDIRLFIQATSMLNTSCVRAGIAPPEYLFDLAEIAAKHINNDEPGWQVFHLHMLLARFRANISHGVITDPYQIIRDALRMDGLCSAIPFVGPDWAFETVHSDLDLDPDSIMVGYYHVYPNFISAQLWNAARATRLALNEIIRKTLLYGFNSQPPIFFELEDTVQFQISTDTIFWLQREILASVPQYLGFGDTTDALPNRNFASAQSPFAPKFPWSCFQSTVYRPTTTSSPPLNDPPLIRSFGGYMLPLSLYAAGDVSITTPTIKQKILKTLRLIGYSMGIQQALILAEKMEGKTIQD
ncbi:hypothetical protein N431DRAFT_470571 [Stipitochalara longipes BDJ]|nr:hypothetical protein N431DRAFT_470571 [Stipitochalara longipes BDJ]